MKTIEVRDQVNLPLKRCFQLCVRGIRYRLFRSAVTVIIVSLAVAFLMMMLSTSYIDRQVARDVRQRTEGRRLLEHWVDKLSMPLTADVLSEELAGPDLQTGTGGWNEMLRWGGLSNEQMLRLKNVALDQRVFTRFMANLKPEERSALVGTREGEQRLQYLAQPDGLSEFFSKVTSFPRGREWMQHFIDEFTATRPQREAIVAGHASAVDALKKELGGRTVLDLLARSDAASLEMLRRCGFAPDEASLARLKDEAVLALDAQKIASLLQDERMRSLIANKMGTTVLQDRHVFSIGQSDPAWLRSEVAQTRKLLESSNVKGRGMIEPLELSDERIKVVSRARLKQMDLAEVEQGLSGLGEGEGWLGFSTRTGWLILISFMVCVVGVANAMLMSVTERFREIATMKCLGAMDSFIMIIFVMESSLQGLAGGLTGVVIGLLLGLLRSLGGFGLLAVSNLPPATLAGSAGACLLAGVVLAALAALYPAWVAARLAPMEAMRIE